MKRPDAFASDLITMLGYQTAAALAKAMGGERLYIPATGRDTRASRIIRPCNLAMLQMLWAGRTIRVPTLDDLARAERNVEIVQLAKAGVPHGQIAERVGLTRQRVRALVRATG